MKKKQHDVCLTMLVSYDTLVEKTNCRMVDVSQICLTLFLLSPWSFRSSCQCCSIKKVKFLRITFLQKHLLGTASGPNL